MHPIPARQEQGPIRLLRVGILAFAILAVVLVAVVLAAGLGGGSKHASGEAKLKTPEIAAAPRAPAGHVSWVIAAEDLESLRSDNAGLARRFFDNRETFVVGKIGGAQDEVPRGYRAIPTLNFTSLRAFERDVHYGRIDPRIAAVIYDPERWSKTPVSEQKQPLAAMHRFTDLAARWGYGPIVAPGRDLALEAGGGCGKRVGEFLDEAYVRCGLIAGASGAENFVVQAAPDELALNRLHALLQGSRRQLTAMNPAPSVLASLSTEPPENEAAVWPIDLVRAAKLELKHFPGIMFNFTPQTTELAASFLRDLEREQPVAGLLVARGN